MSLASLPSALASLLLVLGAAGCSGPPASDDAGLDAAPDDAYRGPPDGSVPCVESSPCDDGIDCTHDSCGALGYCLHAPDNGLCMGGTFCGGAEVCDPGRGCVAGTRQACDDHDTCTLDHCNESMRLCEHGPRDLDRDLDADQFCGGGDCDDSDPARSSLAPEICADGVDNDCDGMVDEATCGRPPHDACDDPLDVSAGGTFVVNTSGTTADYALGCGGAQPDIVLSFTLTEPQNVVFEANSGLFLVALALRSTCDVLASEIECRVGFTNTLARRALPAGTYYVIVQGVGGSGEIAVTASFGPPTPAPTNETCASPIDVSAGGVFPGSMLDVANDLTTGCGFGADLVYALTTTAEQDIRVALTSSDGAAMSWELRPTCASGVGALRCAYGALASGTVHRVPAGSYFLVVEGASEADFTLAVDILAPTPPPPGDQCDMPLPLTAGVRASGTVVGFEDDYATTCGFRYRDAVYTFTLAAPQDVTIDVDSGSNYMNASLRRACADGATQIVCEAGAPLHMRVRALPAGTYYLLVETSRETVFTVNLATNTPRPLVMVSGNETCPTAVIVPETGGLYGGNTTGMVDDYHTSLCPSTGPGPDAVFRLDLTAPRRVIASTDGSTFDTLLAMHTTMCVSGAETACDDDGGAGVTSQLDRMLTPGVYYFIVDGYGAGSSGSYTFEILVP